MLARRLRRASGDWGERSRIQWRALNTKTRAGVATALPGFGELLQLGVVGRNVDFDGHQLVAAFPVLGCKAATLEAQHPPRRGTLGNGHHDRAFGRRDLHLRAERALLERHRKIEPDVVALAGIEAMGSNLDGDDGVAAAARPFLTLAAEADSGSVLQPLRKFQIDRLAVGEGDTLRLQRHRILERHLQPIGDVGALLWRSGTLAESTERTSGASTAGTAEQAFEQVAQVRALRTTEIEVLEPRARLRAARSCRIAAEPAAERHLRIALLVDLAPVIAGALVLVGQQVVGGG